jgi:WD40 repeat protein
MPRLAERESTLSVKAWDVNVKDYVIRLAWSPDGRILAAACVSGPIHLLDVITNCSVRVLKGHEFGTQCLSWSHDSKRLVSGGQDGRVNIWEPESGELLHSLNGGSSWVEQVTFAPALPLFVSAAGRHLKLWDIQGNLVQAYPPHPSTISDVQWQGGQKFFTSGAYGQLATFAPDSPKPVKSFAWKGSILTLAWSPDGNYIATGNQDASVHFWYRKSGKDLEMSGYVTKVRELAWDSSSRYLATGGSPAVVIWDCGGKGPAGSRPIQLSRHDRLISALEYQHRGQLLASGCEEGLVCIWSPLLKQSLLQTFRLDGAVTQVRWSRNDRLLAASSANGLVRILMLEQ